MELIIQEIIERLTGHLTCLLWKPMMILIKIKLKSLALPMTNLLEVQVSLFLRSLLKQLRPSWLRELFLLMFGMISSLLFKCFRQHFCISIWKVYLKPHHLRASPSQTQYLADYSTHPNSFSSNLKLDMQVHL